MRRTNTPAWTACKSASWLQTSGPAPTNFWTNTHHHGALTPVGERLHHAVTDAQGDWLGVLVFCAAARRRCPRDQWLGWSDEQRRRRRLLARADVGREADAAGLDEREDRRQHRERCERRRRETTDDGAAGRAISSSRSTATSAARRTLEPDRPGPARLAQRLQRLRRRRALAADAAEAGEPVSQ